MSTVRSIDVPEQHKNSPRPKLLFLAYPFPPLRIAASVRTWNTAKYLARLGWKVTVVTPHPSVWRNIDHAEELSIKLEIEEIDRILTEHRWRFLNPSHLNCDNHGMARLLGGSCRRLARWLQVDAAIGWSKPAERACASLTPEDVDVILATGTPFSSFRLAKLLSDKLGRPYVLDYRDPWTGNPHALSRPHIKTIREETKVLAGCAAAIIVTPSWAEAIDRRFGLGRKLHVITNGYDPEELASIEPFVFGHSAIVYAGTFYRPKRVITPVMAALKRLKETRDSAGDDWYFHYYGREENHVREEATKYGVLDRVVLHGNVPRAEALAAVRGAEVTVIITTVHERGDATDQGIVPGKIFETMGLGTPILLITPPRSDAANLAHNSALVRTFAGNNIDGIAAFLADRIDARSFLATTEQRYAWPNLVKQFDDVLRNCMKNTVEVVNA